MDTKHKIMVMQAYLDGKVIQIFDDLAKDWWTDLNHEPTWDWAGYDYRIKPQKQLIIPWEHIKPKYKWAATDSDGEVLVFIQAPIQRLDRWYTNWGNGCRSLNVLNIDTKDIDWKQSLIERPEGV